tara:strand:- start:1180 stop:1419 length:240 start_codon:yes stop_codon:yes gene_type:complete
MSQDTKMATYIQNIVNMALEEHGDIEEGKESKNKIVRDHSQSFTDSNYYHSVYTWFYNIYVLCFLLSISLAILWIIFNK